jgi:hypothetical protein
MARKNSNRSTNKRKSGGKQKGKTKKNSGASRDTEKIAAVVNDDESSSPVKQRDESSDICAGLEVTRTDPNSTCSHRHLPTSTEQKKDHTQTHHDHHQIPFKLDVACARSLLSKPLKKYLGPNAKERIIVELKLDVDTDDSDSSQIEDDAANEEDSEPPSNTHFEKSEEKTSPDESSLPPCESTETTACTSPAPTDEHREISPAPSENEEQAVVTVAIDLNTVVDIGNIVLSEAPAECINVIEAAPEETLESDDSYPSPMQESIYYVDHDLKESGIISVVIEPSAASELAAFNTTGPESESKHEAISRSSSFSSWSEVVDLNTQAEEDIDGWNAVPLWTS